MEKDFQIPKWDKSYSVGNERIDHQHHYFLNLIEYLNNNVDSNSSREYVKSLLDEVLLYARFHFRSEENMMLYYNYADYSGHKDLHEALLWEITNKVTHFCMGKADLNEIIQFLTGWFISHTVNEDRKFHDSLSPENIS